MSTQSDPQIALPPGWSVMGFRETSQANSAGQIVQGVIFTLGKETGGTTSVFVSNVLLGQTQAIEDVFRERIDAIQRIGG